MRPVLWSPLVVLSAVEQQIVKRVRRAKLFVMLRLRRHELFTEDFQAELAGLSGDSAKGQPPVPPAQLAMALIVQACTQASDDEVIEATVMDRRWQLVLDCLDTVALAALPGFTLPGDTSASDRYFRGTSPSRSVWRTGMCGCRRARESASTRSPMCSPS